MAVVDGGEAVKWNLPMAGALLAAMFAPQTVRNRNDLTSSLLDDVRSFDRGQISHAIRAVFGRDAVDQESELGFVHGRHSGRWPDGTPLAAGTAPTTARAACQPCVP